MHMYTVHSPLPPSIYCSVRMSLRGQDKQTENNNTINNGNWQQKQKTINRDLCHGSDSSGGGSCSEKSKNNQRDLAYQNATHNAQRVSELQWCALSLSPSPLAQNKSCTTSSPAFVSCQQQLATNGKICTHTNTNRNTKPDEERTNTRTQTHIHTEGNTCANKAA